MTEVPSGVQGRSLGRRYGDVEAGTVCRHCLQIVTAETIKIRKFDTIHLPILDQHVSPWRLKDILGA